MNKPRILVIDDEESITGTVASFLRAKGYDVIAINDGEDALDAVAEGTFGIIISDIYIDRVTGLDVLQRSRSGSKKSAVILMTARGSVRTTVEAEMGGAFDYLAKPFEMRNLLSVVERAEAYLSSDEPDAVETAEPEAFGNIVGFSPPMVEVYKRIARSAKSDETVLIVGETGVGKELVARAIHEHSARARAPFLPVDSGAVTGTLWESEIFGAIRGAYTGADRDRQGVVDSARGGSVFFDEIGEIPLDFQPKLLRFLQEREYRPLGSGVPKKADVRIIAATNRSLETMVRENRFREDLFYRLNILRIDVPPLRERRSDIPFLVKRFLSEATEAARKRLWLAPAAERLLNEYAWPGNVRQLRNTIQRAVALGSPGPVTEEAIRPYLADLLQEDDEEPASDLSEVERRQILRVLREAGGNKTKAAEMLGIQRRTLYKKLARMEREQGRDSESETLS
ncbi:MAG TPA: sigma-54 dependent transcriptional regulator [Bryobacteraceae bacterium]|nr:sigma-54 dependent transcriptional regulator [Bryobacteraceae bacterium]